MAAHTPFPVEVLTPEGEAFNGEVEMVSTQTTIGSIGVLAKHQPLLAMLEPTELRLHISEGTIERFAQGEGYLQVSDDSRVLVLVDELTPVDRLDVSALREQLARAEDELARADEGTEAHRVAARARKRAEAFIAIAEGGAGA